MQGDCPSDAPLPAASSQRNPVRSRRVLRSRQCIMLAPLDMFFFYNNAAHNIWLDNLLLRFAVLDSRVAPPTMVRRRKIELPVQSTNASLHQSVGRHLSLLLCGQLTNDAIAALLMPGSCGSHALPLGSLCRCCPAVLAASTL